MDIQWYPGHMAKAKRLLAAQLSKVDLVVELCDARLPLSSRNPALGAMLQHKRRILLLCKADLAENAKTQKWLAFFRAQGIAAMAYDASPHKTKEAKLFIEQAAKEVIERGERRGIAKTIRAIVVGVPNVGKSTFINRLYGGSIAQTGDRPGVTKSNQWVKVSPYLEVLDTPGMLWPKLNDQLAATRLAYIGTIKDAVYNQEELCISLLEDLLEVRPQQTAERFKIKDTSLRGYELLEAVCRGRGFLMRGGVCDTDRGCSVVLDEFRAGKVGKLTLEDVPVPEKEPVKSIETAGDGSND
ncbi:MAG: ribosome biogenesis GTPase YlqF [Clostridiales bacterium]|nr:ribosome biogenesis GTPase YlqF [Clostridiales bacterium]